MTTPLATPLDILRETLTTVFAAISERMPAVSARPGPTPTAVPQAEGYAYVGKFDVKSGCYTRPLLIQQHSATGDFALRLNHANVSIALDERELPYVFIVPKEEVANPLGWLIDTRAAQQYRHAEEYLSSISMQVANQYPDSCASGAAIGFLIHALTPEVAKDAEFHVAAALEKKKPVASQALLA